MSAQFFTVDYVKQYVTDHPDDAIMAGYAAVFDMLLPKHDEAVALVEATDGDNVESLAAANWEASDTPEAKQYAELQAKIAKVLADLAPHQEKAEALRAAGTATFAESAKTYAQEHGANAKQNEAAAFASIAMLLKSLPYAPGTAPEFPAVKRPGKAKGKAGNGTSNRGRKAGSLDWHLATASIDGNAVSFTGDNVTLSNVAKALGITRDGLDSLLRANLNGNVQSPEAGKTLTVKVGVNGADKVLSFVGRQAAKRGRKAKVESATTPEAPATEGNATEAPAA